MIASRKRFSDAWVLEVIVDNSREHFSEHRESVITGELENLLVEMRDCMAERDGITNRLGLYREHAFELFQYLRGSSAREEAGHRGLDDHSSFLNVSQCRAAELEDRAQMPGHNILARRVYHSATL